jgi:hypothetical protein
LAENRGQKKISTAIPYAGNKLLPMEIFDQATLSYLSTLRYSQIWLESRVLQKAELKKQISDYNNGIDSNKEHYRYKTFVNFLKSQSSFDNATFQQIIEILKADEDRAMACSATLVLLQTHYLTNQQFETAAAFLQTCFKSAVRYLEKIKLERFLNGQANL